MKADRRAGRNASRDTDKTTDTMSDDVEEGSAASTTTSFISRMKHDSSSLHVLHGADGMVREPYDDEIDRATYTMDYNLVVIMHADSEMRPCRPVLQVVNAPKLDRSQQKFHDGRGTQLIKTCQLADQSLNLKGYITIDPSKILCVYSLRITDSESTILINTISSLNTLFSQNDFSFSERSNIAFVPVSLHGGVFIGTRHIKNMKNTASATDVQIAVMAIRESLSAGRSLCVRLQMLHPYMATPENLHEAVQLFMKKLDVAAFKIGIMKSSDTI